MTLLQLCALTPHLCRMAEDPAIRSALETLSQDVQADRAPLAEAMASHPEDAARALTILGCRDSLSSRTLRQYFSRNTLAFFHLCGQCSPGEMLDVLTRCTVPPTAEALAVLLSRQRRKEAMERYALQLLWRINGDTALPDAFDLFPEQEVTA